MGEWEWVGKEGEIGKSNPFITDTHDFLSFCFRFVFLDWIRKSRQTAERVSIIGYRTGERKGMNAGGNEEVMVLCHLGLVGRMGQLDI